TIAGNGIDGFNGDDGPATRAEFDSVQGIAVGPDGSIYLADSLNHRIRRVSQPLPGFTGSNLSIPSADGSEIFQFDSSGRHLQTLDALTGVPIYKFGYDGGGRLASVTDFNNNVTTFEHDAAGNPTAVIGPYGELTTLGVNGAGYLAAVTNPAGETTSLGY